MTTVAEGDPKVPFSLATLPKWKWGHYSLPSIAPLYPWSVPYTELNPGFLGHWWTLYPLDQSQLLFTAFINQEINVLNWNSFTHGLEPW